MNFRDPDFLRRHIESIFEFYHPRCIDSVNGGFYHHFRDNGSVYDPDTRHLVSSCRFVFNYAMMAHEFQRPEYLSVVEHGLRFIQQAHWQADSGSYAWTLTQTSANDRTNHCYGLAFVLLAAATALKAGVRSARTMLDSTAELMERRFWLPEYGLYADEASPDWSTLAAYRGQNANMHSCEAFIAGYEASGEQQYLDRALLLAEQACNRLAPQANGQIWEHYDSNWQIDWDYNKDDPANLFRPWGFQPGHQTEWSKLLLILSRYHPAEWLVQHAESLFSKALPAAWDSKHGGMVYGLAPDGSVCDSDKYFWVQAETFATAAALAVKTGKSEYWDWYDKIWDYSWQHMVDHQYGAWYRILTRDNRKYSNEKSPAGKTDYHTMGACYEVLRWLRD